MTRLTPLEKRRLLHCLFQFYRKFWRMPLKDARLNADFDLADLEGQ